MKRVAFYWQMVKIFSTYPISLFKSFNFYNLKRFTKAVQEEPLRDILDNVSRYLEQGGSKLPVSNFIGLKEAIDSKLAGRKIYLFVSHEATLTGAPLIILNIARSFYKFHEVLPIFLIGKSGEMNDQFSDSFPTHFLYNKNPARARKVLDFLNSNYQIDRVIINSAESQFILKPLMKFKFVNITFLIHEMGNFYEKNLWSEIDLSADNIIFPAQAVKRLALRNSSFNRANIFVRGQGLMKTAIYEYDLNLSKSLIRNEMDMDPNSLIVLGCGSTIRRKGVDLFLLTALSVLNEYGGNKPVYFVWIGDAPNKTFLDRYLKDIKSSKHKKAIKFIGLKSNVLPYFVGSDLFYLTSRGDPFPCVAQEAVAAGLPIVGFKDSGGIEEMVQGLDSFLVPYLDIHSAAKEIVSLLSNEAQLKEHRWKSKRYAQKKYDFKRYADSIFNIVNGEGDDNKSFSESEFRANERQINTDSKSSFRIDHNFYINHSRKKSNARSEIFMVRGYAKSGTNWVSNIVNQHPSVTCKGEFHLEHLFQGLRNTKSSRWGLLKDASELDEAYYDMIYNLITAKCGHAPLCGDRTPSSLHSTFLPGCKVIYISRDGRDAMVSWAYHALRMGIIGFPGQKNKEKRF